MTDGSDNNCVANDASADACWCPRVGTHTCGSELKCS